MYFNYIVKSKNENIEIVSRKDVIFRSVLKETIGIILAVLLLILTIKETIIPFIIFGLIFIMITIFFRI